jgi:RNA polymerase sigma factor (sigma-70 family)
MGVRILICDDHPLFREGLRRMLETVSDFEVVAEAERSDRALELCREHRPDVALLDVELPGGSGIGAAERLRADLPDVRVLVLSAFGDPERVRRAIDAGANGYLLKNAPPKDVIAAIRAVATGGSAFAPWVAEAMLEDARRDSAGQQMRRNLARLSEREREVLKLAAAGQSNAEIGQRLFISEGTVKNHFTHILRKLGLEDRTQAAVAAVKHGLAE